ncbi:MAG: DUF2807 domain-containing protein [Alistipes sp.]|nr:DUF2807 domain-containing protein [Alistipes sp.]
MKKITLFFCVLALSSCVNIGTTIKLAKGPIEERTIIIPESATALVTSHGADVTVDYSLAPNEVCVKTHSDIFDILNIEVEESTLSIGIEQNSLCAKTFEVRIPALAYNDIAVLGGSDFTWSNGVAESLTITASGGADVELNGGVFINMNLSVSGGADASLNNIKAENVDITASGGADVEATGQCSILNVTVSGGADADLDELHAEQANVSASGGSDSTVYASKTLNIDATGGADVSYYGSPISTHINISGGADVECEEINN